MNTVRTNTFEKLLTLQQAAAQLAVSVDVLLDWNEHNILKPTITPTGEIGYTKKQLDHFLTIRSLMVGNIPNAPATPPTSQSNPATSPLPQLSFQSPTSMVGQLMHAEQAQAYFHFQTQTIPHHGLTKEHGNKSSSSVFVVAFLAVIIVLTFAIIPPQDVQISKLSLSGQTMTSLPIPLKHDDATKKTIDNEAESIAKEKMAATTLSSSRDTLAASTQSTNTSLTSLPPRPQNYVGSASDAAIDQQAMTDSYALSAIPSEEITDDENSAFDDRGNIKGVAKTDTLATIVGDIDEMVRGDSQNNINATNQIIFLSIGTLIALFIFQKQLAYSFRKSPATKVTPPTHPMLTHHKALEISQKTDGTVVLLFMGNEYKISKPEMNSESDQFIERLMSLTQPNLKEIEYDSMRSDAIRLTTPLSRLVTRLGFVGIKRDLFFPRTSKTSVLFRKYLTEADLKSMNLTTDHLLRELQKTDN